MMQRITSKIKELILWMLYFFGWDGGAETMFRGKPFQSV